MEQESREVIHRIEITGNLNRHDVEELYLELRRLTQRYAVQIEQFHFEKLRDKAIDADEP